jgi:hypothetical protein
MPTWILERDVFNVQHFDSMVSHAQSRHWPLHIVRVKPFEHIIEGPVPVTEGPVVVYGSIGVQKLAQQHNWIPGVFGDDQLFRQDVYAEALGDLILNPNPTVTYLSEVMDATVGQDSFFIKPNDDNKAFAGFVLPREEFEIWVNRMREIGYLDNQDIEVVVSPPQELAMEWRNIVVDGKLIESSIYRQWQSVMPERDRRPEVEELVLEAHSRFKPADVYVIDVAQTRQGLKVVEYNTFNSAGTYACDIPNIMDAVSDFVDRT